MDGISSSCEREVKRSFQVDRHSPQVLAKAFELLLAVGSSAEVQPTEQCTSEDARIQLLQEANG